MFGLNEPGGLKAIAFVDDLILYFSYKIIENVESKLQEKFISVNDFFKTWRLKINIEMCETILFRPRTFNMYSKTENRRKTFVSEKTWIVK